MKNKKLFKLIKDTGRFKIILGILLTILNSALSYIPYFAVYKVIVQLMNKTLTYQQLMMWASITLITVVFRTLSITMASFLTHTVAFNAMHRLRLQVIEHMSKLNLGFFNNKNKGSLKTTLFDDIGRLENFIAHNIIQLTQALVVPIGLIIVLFVMQPILTICVLIPGILGVVLPMRKMKKYPQLTNQFTKSIEELNASSNEMVNCIKTLKMFNITATKFKRYTSAVKTYVNTLITMAKMSCKPIAITVVVLDSSLLFTIPIGGLLYLNGQIEAATLLLFGLLSMCLYSNLQSLMTIRMGMMELNSGLANIDEILALKPIVSGNKTVSKNEVEVLEFKKLCFKYDEDEVLNNINLICKPNTVTAFVGASGAGKTTAAQLIGKYWVATKGAIKINGININELKEESLMDLTSFVFQEQFMLQASIYENITMGCSYSKQLVIKAAKEAQIHDFIVSLPDGYQTKVTGIKLSGGQMQRISIARAILKDSAIVVLDEATSFSDIENERKIQLALQNLLKNKIVIMIAHRLNTIQNADNIVVFDKGKIVEHGKHSELLSKNAVYHSMWQIFISSYREGVE
ncbi:ABC transporter ATP-binding protein [Clostridium sp. 'deep sea']|uniref:ABC transporter ATP-binding protein n=1 Tax=Clostridium sp. 'deep sea' TaxID=2779445 RepID=UPI00189652F5|nr:ABC transporter ATP-binding protein [Clostridium sp. 'deep sea']QOR36298.1 ABC transporter ATP-binding protein [Clostridium sp. 'deep sea']